MKYPSYEERQVTQIIEAQIDLKEKPKFKVRDYVEIYCGRDEGCCFWIKAVRWNVNRGKFEYLRDEPPFNGGDWREEGTVVRG